MIVGAVYTLVIESTIKVTVDYLCYQFCRSLPFSSYQVSKLPQGIALRYSSVKIRKIIRIE